MKTLEFSREVGAPPQVVWPLISDMAGFADAAPNLSRVEVLEGAGEGMARRCYDHRGNGWDEVCTLWEEGRRYEMRVRTETYPSPLKQMFRELRGAWEVEPTGAGSLISMRYDIEPTAVGKAVWMPIRWSFSRACGQILDHWQREIEARAALAGAQTA